MSLVHIRCKQFCLEIYLFPLVDFDALTCLGKYLQTLKNSLKWKGDLKKKQ